MSHYNKKEVKKPEWFNLENYKNVNDAELEQWGNNFAYRLDIYMWLDESFHLLSDTEENKDNIEAGLTVCKEKGFITFNENNNDTEVLNIPPLIKDLTLGDIEIGLLNNGQESITKILKNLESLDFSNGIFDQMIAEKSHEAIISEDADLNKIHISNSSNYYDFVSVDLTAPVPDIMKEFKSWVVKKKKEYGNIARKNITAEDIRIWRDSKIIPYLDLLLWHKQQEKKMPSDFIVGSWIFPEKHLNGESQLREKTKPMFKKITSKHFMAYLSGQIIKNRLVSVQK